jgi:hypothetical protein
MPKVMTNVGQTVSMIGANNNNSYNDNNINTSSSIGIDKLNTPLPVKRVDV